MEQQDKTKLRLSVSTMIKCFRFFCFFIRVIGVVSYFSLYAYDLVDKRQIEVVYIITKIM